MIFSYTWVRQPKTCLLEKCKLFLQLSKSSKEKLHPIHGRQWQDIFQTRCFVPFSSGSYMAMENTHTHTNTQRKHKLYKNASTVFNFFLLNFQSFTASFGKGRHSMIALLTLFLNILKRWWSFVYRFQSHQCTVLLFFLQINTWEICVVLAPHRSSRHRVTVTDHLQHPTPPPHPLPSFDVIKAKNVESIHNLSRNDCRPGKLIKLVLAFSLYGPRR